MFSLLCSLALCGFCMCRPSLTRTHCSSHRPVGVGYPLTCAPGQWWRWWWWRQQWYWWYWCADVRWPETYRWLFHCLTEVSTGPGPGSALVLTPLMHCCAAVKDVCRSPIPGCIELGWKYGCGSGSFCFLIHGVYTLQCLFSSKVSRASTAAPAVAHGNSRDPPSSSSGPDELQPLEDLVREISVPCTVHLGAHGLGCLAAPVPKACMSVTVYSAVLMRRALL